MTLPGLYFNETTCMSVFALTFLDHLPEEEKNSFYHCNIPISDENVTCPNQKLLVRGDGQVVTAMTGMQMVQCNRIVSACKKFIGTNDILTEIGQKIGKKKLKQET